MPGVTGVNRFGPPGFARVPNPHSDRRRSAKGYVRNSTAEHPGRRIRPRQSMTNASRPVILIPAYNEEATVGRVVACARRLWGWPVVVIDDCSTDATASVARAAGALVLPLTIQLGAWGAIQTGMRYALRQGFRTAITLDADGQHEPENIGHLLDLLTEGRADVSIGAFPERASRARLIAWSYFRLITGLEIADITSGFRAYNEQAMAVLASREASLLDYQDVGVLLILRRKGLRVVETEVRMQPRAAGASRVFRSWWVVRKYMIQTSLLCLARIGYNHLPPAVDD